MLRSHRSALTGTAQQGRTATLRRHNGRVPVQVDLARVLHSSHDRATHIDRGKLRQEPLPVHRRAWPRPTADPNDAVDGRPSGTGFLKRAGDCRLRPVGASGQCASGQQTHDHQRCRPSPHNDWTYALSREVPGRPVRTPYSPVLWSGPVYTACCVRWRSSLVSARRRTRPGLPGARCSSTYRSSPYLRSPQRESTGPTARDRRCCHRPVRRWPCRWGRSSGPDHEHDGQDAEHNANAERPLENQGQDSRHQHGDGDTGTWMNTLVRVAGRRRHVRVDVLRLHGPVLFLIALFGARPRRHHAVRSVSWARTLPPPWDRRQVPLAMAAGLRQNSSADC